MERERCSVYSLFPCLFPWRLPDFIHSDSVVLQDNFRNKMGKCAEVSVALPPFAMFVNAKGQLVDREIAIVTVIFSFI